MGDGSVQVNDGQIMPADEFHRLTEPPLTAPDPG